MTEELDLARRALAGQLVLAPGDRREGNVLQAATLTTIANLALVVGAAENEAICFSPDRLRALLPSEDGDFGSIPEEDRYGLRSLLALAHAQVGGQVAAFERIQAKGVGPDTDDAFRELAEFFHTAAHWRLVLLRATGPDELPGVIESFLAVDARPGSLDYSVRFTAPVTERADLVAVARAGSLYAALEKLATYVDARGRPDAGGYGAVTYRSRTSGAPLTSDDLDDADATAVGLWPEWLRSSLYGSRPTWRHGLVLGSDEEVPGASQIRLRVSPTQLTLR